MLRTRVLVGPKSGLILSVLFAVLFTAVGAFEQFLPQLSPVYGEQSPITLRVPYGARIVRHAQGELFDVTFQHERIVVPLGTKLKPGVEAHRAAVKWDHTRRPPSAVRLGSAFVLYLFGLLILVTYFVRFGHSRLRMMRAQFGLLSRSRNKSDLLH